MIVFYEGFKKNFPKNTTDSIRFFGVDDENTTVYFSTEFIGVNWLAVIAFEGLQVTEHNGFYFLPAKVIARLLGENSFIKKEIDILKQIGEKNGSSRVL